LDVIKLEEHNHETKKQAHLNKKTYKNTLEMLNKEKLHLTYELDKISTLFETKLKEVVALRKVANLG
jgi:hypothetical protein